MACRIILEFNSILLNDAIVEGLTCIASIHDCAEITQTSVLPFPDKMVFDVPNFRGYISLVFQQQGRNYCGFTVPLLQLFDRETNRFDFNSFNDDPKFQNFTADAVIRAVYPKEILSENLNIADKTITNVFESKSLLSEDKQQSQQDKEAELRTLPAIVLVSKVITPTEIKYEERKLWETLIPGIDTEGDIIQIREEILKIAKTLNEVGEVVHQTNNKEEKETNKRAKDHVLLVDRQYDSLTELDEGNNVVDRQDEFRETQYKPDAHDPSHIHASTEGYHTSYNPQGEILHREEFKQELTDLRGSHEGEGIPVTYEELLQRKIRLEQLIYDIESKFHGQPIDQDTVAVLQTLKRVVSEILQGKLTQIAIETGESNVMLNPQALTIFRSTSSPPIFEEERAPQFYENVPQQQQQPTPLQQQTAKFEAGLGQPQQIYDSSQMVGGLTYPVEENKGYSYGPKRLPGEEHGIAYAPKIKVTPEAGAGVQDSGRSIEDESPEFGQKPRNWKTLSEMYKKSGSSKKSPTKIPQTAEYVLDLKNSLAVAATNFIDDELSRGIIYQMSLNKKRLIPVCVKKSIPLGGKDEVKITARNYFQDSCSKKYLHYFEPNSKCLFLLNVNKKILEDPASPQVFEKVDLDIPFDISPHYRSIITPNGYIYILSGQPAANPNEHSGSCDLFNYNTNGFLEKTPMGNANRKDFGLIHFSKNLFVIGGVGKDGITNTCYRYDIRSDEWISIAPMERAVKHPSLCLFQNHYIFRFFGINNYGIIDLSIERFDGLKNKWQNVTPERKTALHDVYLPMCYQVTDDHIFVFGGKNVNDFESTKCEGYLIKVDERTTPLKLEVIKTKNQIPGFSGLLNYNSLFLQDTVLYTMREGNFSILK